MLMCRKNTLLLAAVGTWVTLWASVLYGCSVPVFQYALEYWDASPYEVIVFHQGPLSPETEAEVARLRQIRSNITVQAVDLAEAIPPRMQKLVDDQIEDKLPWVVVCFPGTPEPEGILRSGPLTRGFSELIVDSPKRREVVQAMLDGCDLVWVLLESGDKGRDAAAADLLVKQSAWPNGTGEPALTERDPQPDVRGAVSCAVVRLSRRDRGEEIFVSMLLRSDPGLGRDRKEPIAFPVFGRGRVLCALAGGGINEETVQEVMSFLTGPCSCLVQDTYPGLDLLMSVEWREVVSKHSGSAGVLPSLNAASGPPAPDETTEASDSGAERTAGRRPEANVWRNIVVLLVVVTMVVVVGVLLVRKGFGRLK